MASSAGSVAVSRRDPHGRFLALQYFPPLDGLRCLSIIGVIGFHALGIADPVFGRGSVGVELFFVISGFLITTLLLREKDRNGSVSLRNFYIRRGLRIFPLYYAVLLAYLLLVVSVERNTAAGQQFIRHVPAFLTYTSNWFVQLDAPRVIFYFAWSLATEEQFYLMWPSIVRFARRRFTPLVVMSLLLVGDQTMELLTGRGILDFGAVGNRVVTSVATPICAGCILAYALHTGRTFTTAFAVLGRRFSLPLALVATIVIYALPGTPNLLLYLAMAALVGAACIRPDPGAAVMLTNPLSRYLGTISYGMYLLHMLALNAARRLGAHGRWTEFAAGLALTILAASASYRFFEKPFLNLKERWTRARSGALSAPVGAPQLQPVIAAGTIDGISAAADLPRRVVPGSR